jgi:hypothetical protein
MANYNKNVEQLVRDADGNYHPFEAKKQEANND